MHVDHDALAAHRTATHHGAREDEAIAVDRAARHRLRALPERLLLLRLLTLQRALVERAERIVCGHLARRLGRRRSWLLRLVREPDRRARDLARGLAAFLLCVALTSLADAELDRVRGRRVEARDARDAPVRVDREARDHEGGIGPRLPRDEVGERALHLVEDALGDRALADLP